MQVGPAASHSEPRRDPGARRGKPTSARHGGLHTGAGVPSPHRLRAATELPPAAEPPYFRSKLGCPDADEIDGTGGCDERDDFRNGHGRDDRADPRDVDDLAELGALGQAVRGQGPPCARTRWPGLEAEPAQLRKDPTPLKGLSVKDIVDNYETIIRGLDRPPIIMGHSFGGIDTQLLIDRRLGAAASRSAGSAEAFCGCRTRPFGPRGRRSTTRSARTTSRR